MGCFNKVAVCGDNFLTVLIVAMPLYNFNFLFITASVGYHENFALNRCEVHSTSAGATRTRRAVFVPD